MLLHMAERGGTTTQSGIYYQNAVAAIYLGYLFDHGTQPESERILRVRVEAPTSVDDIVVSYIDGHVSYIQAKEVVRVGDEAWQKAWRDFASQYVSPEFQKTKDKLVLHVGNSIETHHQLEAICAKARNSTGRHSEWLTRLTKAQRRLVDNINLSLKPELLNDVDLFEFFGHVEVKIWPLSFIERDLVSIRIPQSNISQLTLYRVLHNLVGGKARNRGDLAADTLRSTLEKERIFLATPSSIDSLRLAVRQCSAMLHAYKSTIGRTGIHIRRSVVDQVIDWVHTITGNKHVALLLDQAGMGKSVAIRDILTEFEAQSIITFAIKADQQLTGVKLISDLSHRLGLPESVEAIVTQLAAFERVVVLIDQIDALSLSLAHDEQALNITLDLIARLNRIPGVAIILSCRIFDRNSDPRLQRIEAAAEFSLSEFSDEEVASVLNHTGVTFSDLQLPLQKLLKTPLHLDLFVRAVEDKQPNVNLNTLSQITSLQDLYDLLWTNIIMKPLPEGPAMGDREAVLRTLANHMSLEQRTTAPYSLFTEADSKHLERAVAWLASEGVIISGGIEWSFLHQTFFDYMYAKQFIERGVSLTEVILQGDQGLFARPQIVQILAYLRGRDNSRYLRELQQLLDAGYDQPSSLRAHLRNLLIRWFGSLISPSDDEWVIAQRLLLHPERRINLIYAMQGNLAWFVRLKDSLLLGLLHIDNESTGNAITSYLISMIEVAQVEVLSFIEPYLERSDAWSNRIALIVSSIRANHTPEAVALFERLCQLFPVFHLNHLYELNELVGRYPSTVCRLIRLAFDRNLTKFLEQRATSQHRYLPSFSSALEELNSGSIVDALQSLSEQASEEFLETMLPWVEQVLYLSGEPPKDYPAYWDDEFSYHWHDSTFVVKFSVTRSLRLALVNLAKSKPSVFQAFCNHLIASPYETPHLLVANSYSAMPEQWAGEALKYIIGDKRRLELGGNWYDSMQLISKIHLQLSESQRLVLEYFILSYTPIRKHMGVRGLEYRGIQQLHLLCAIPRESLSARAVKALQEWQRKFPDVIVHKEPAIVRWVEDRDAVIVDEVRKMSDRSWLREITKEQKLSREDAPFRNRDGRLSGVLTDLIKEQPDRFIPLLNRITGKFINMRYVVALLNGVAASSVSSEVIFSVVRRFIDREEHEIQFIVAQILEQRVDTGFPGDIVAFLEKQALTNIVEPIEQHNDPYHAYINSNRGRAFNILMRILDAKATADAKQQKWHLIEQVIADAPSSLRAGAIQELLYLLSEDRERAVALFLRLMEGHPSLLRSPFTQEFIYYGMYRRFLIILRFIRALMDNENEQCQQQGAVLACLASISPKALETEENLAIAQAMADAAITGRVTWRRGAAIVYAHNIKREAGPICARRLLLLLEDDDDSVLNHISSIFYSLRPEHIFALRNFIEAYAASSCYYTNNRQFLDYLSEVALIDPDWTMLVIGIIVGNVHRPETSRWYRGGADLIRIILRIYNDPTAKADRRAHAMDLFDQLTEQYSGEAQMVLSEWDKR